MPKIQFLTQFSIRNHMATLLSETYECFFDQKEFGDEDKLVHLVRSLNLEWIRPTDGSKKRTDHDLGEERLLRRYKDGQTKAGNLNIAYFEVSIDDSCLFTFIS